MFKFYSEIPGARLREMLADLSTWAWVALWTVVGVRIHDAISGFAEAGRVLRGGGDNIEAAGAQLGDALAGLPLVGAGIDDITTKTFATAGEPFQYVGGELESLLILIAGCSRSSSLPSSSSRGCCAMSRGGRPVSRRSAPHTAPSGAHPSTCRRRRSSASWRRGH